MEFACIEGNSDLEQSWKLMAARLSQVCYPLL